MINTHQAHNFFLGLKKILFFEIFPQIPLDSQRDMDRKINFFSNPKLSVYFMCHMCTNQFYDSESFIDWCCLKKLNFELIHIRHTNFFWIFLGGIFWKIFFKFRWIYSVISIQKNSPKKIQKKLMCLMGIDSKFNFLRQYQSIKLSES